LKQGEYGSLFSETTGGDQEARSYSYLQQLGIDEERKKKCEKENCLADSGIIGLFPASNYVVQQFRFIN
jgi:hypothetical protein